MLQHIQYALNDTAMILITKTSTVFKLFLFCCWSLFTAHYDDWCWCRLHCPCMCHQFIVAYSYFCHQFAV